MKALRASQCQIVTPSKMSLQLLEVEVDKIEHKFSINF